MSGRVLAVVEEPRFLVLHWDGGGLNVLRRGAAKSLAPPATRPGSRAGQAGCTVCIMTRAEIDAEQARQRAEVAAEVAPKLGTPRAAPPRLRPVRGKKRAVALHLLASGGGWEAASVPGIAAATGLSKRQVQNALGAMRREGPVEFVKTPGAANAAGWWRVPDAVALRLWLDTGSKALGSKGAGA